MGRKRKLSEEQIQSLIQEVRDGQGSIAEICERYGITAPTYYSYLRKQAASSVYSGVVDRVPESNEEVERGEQVL